MRKDTRIEPPPGFCGVFWGFQAAQGHFFTLADTGLFDLFWSPEGVLGCQIDSQGAKDGRSVNIWIKKSSKSKISNF